MVVTLWAGGVDETGGTIGLAVGNVASGALLDCVSPAGDMGGAAGAAVAGRSRDGAVRKLSGLATGIEPKGTDEAASECPLSVAGVSLTVRAALIVIGNCF